MLKVDCEMPREGEHSGKRHVAEARRLINYQNEMIGTVQMRAAKLGVLVPGVRLNNVRTAPHTAKS
jgi:hypothetical protein